MQDTLLEMVVLDARFVTQSLQLAAAVGAEIHHLADVVGSPGRGALSQKRERPAPLGGIQSWPEQQGRVGLEQPFHDFQRGGRVGPRLRMGNGDLTAVGITGFQAGLVLAINHSYLVPLLLQIPGRGSTHNACAQNQYMHACLRSNRIRHPTA